MSFCHSRKAASSLFTMAVAEREFDQQMINYLFNLVTFASVSVILQPFVAINGILFISIGYNGVSFTASQNIIMQAATEQSQSMLQFMHAVLQNSTPRQIMAAVYYGTYGIESTGLDTQLKDMLPSLEVVPQVKNAVEQYIRALTDFITYSNIDFASFRQQLWTALQNMQ